MFSSFVHAAIYWYHKKYAAVASNLLLFFERLRRKIGVWCEMKKKKKMRGSNCSESAGCLASEGSIMFEKYSIVFKEKIVSLQSCENIVKHQMIAVNLLTSAAVKIAASAQKVSRKLFMASPHSSNLTHLSSPFPRISPRWEKRNVRRR